MRRERRRLGSGGGYIAKGDVDTPAARIDIDDAGLDVRAATAGATPLEDAYLALLAQLADGPAPCWDEDTGRAVPSSRCIGLLQ